MTKAKEALDDFEACPSGLSAYGDTMWIDGDIKPETYETIRRALRILNEIETTRNIFSEGYNQCLDDLRGVE